MSIHCQDIRLWEYKKKIMKEKMPWCFIKFSQLILKGNAWRSVWRICMWILGLKGLKEISWAIIFFSGPLLQYQENWIAISTILAFLQFSIIVLNTLGHTCTCNIVVVLIRWSKFPTNQKYYQDLGSDESSVCNFSAVSSGRLVPSFNYLQNSIE